MGLAIVFAFLLVAVVRPILEYETQFVATTCAVRDTRVGEAESTEDTGYRPELLVAYSVNGGAHEQWGTTLHGTYGASRRDALDTLLHYQVGQSYPCKVDPAHAEHVVAIVEGSSYTGLLWLLILLPFALVIGRNAWFWWAMRDLEPE